MKRSSFLKRTPLRRKSISPVAKLKRKLWKVFAPHIKKRDKYTCFTCGRKAEGMGLHAGHFIPKSVGGILLYFNEDNVKAQCYNCNINLGGNQYIFGQKLGKEKVDELYKIKTRYFKVTVEWYEQMIQKYEHRV